MRCISLSIFALIGLVQAKQNLRYQSQQRQLVVTSNVPFDANMRIQVSEESKDQQPSQGDYNGALLAFQSWFHENSDTFYHESSKYDVTYISTACQLTPGKTTHNPSATGNEFHHYIGISCQSTFRADNNDDMIRSVDLVREASTYPLQTFISDFLRPASPASSPFHSTRRLSIQFFSSSSPPSSGGQNPTIPTIPPASTPAPGATTKGTIPITLQWTLSVQPQVQDRQPTQGEYNNFMKDSEAWVRDIFYNYFDGTDGKHATFTGTMTSHIQASSYDETEDFPHTITVRTNAEFEQAYGEVLPDTLTWAATLRSTGITVFREQYLAQTPGLFQYPAYLGWKTL